VIYTTHVFLCAGLLIKKKTGTMALVLLGSALVNLGINCLLLPRIGLMAAALATLVSYALCIALLAWVSHRYLPLAMPVGSLLKYGLAAVAVASAASTIELHPLLLNLAVRSTAATLGYTGLLYCLEPRLRRAAAAIWRRAGRSSGFVEAAAEICS